MARTKTLCNVVHKMENGVSRGCPKICREVTRFDRLRLSVWPGREAISVGPLNVLCQQKEETIENTHTCRAFWSLLAVSKSLAQLRIVMLPREVWARLRFCFGMGRAPVAPRRRWKCFQRRGTRACADDECRDYVGAPRLIARANYPLKSLCRVLTQRGF